MSNGSEAAGATLTVGGAVMTQTPVSLAQVAGIVIGAMGILIQIYSVWTRNHHNKFVRENHHSSQKPGRSDADPGEG